MKRSSAEESFRSFGGAAAAGHDQNSAAVPPQITELLRADDDDIPRAGVRLTFTARVSEFLPSLHVALFYFDLLPSFPPLVLVPPS